MIALYTWPTPNGQKVHIALEELGLPYQVNPVNIGQGEQFAPAFLAITPNHRIPAIVDPDGPGGEPLGLFESGAILIYLAEKAGRLIPQDAAARYVCLQWLMFQMGGVGPMFGQWNHFARYAPERIPYAVERYTNEAQRLMRVLEKRLSAASFLAGEDYSIADIATYPWVAAARASGAIAIEALPAVARWIDAIAARPAVVRGMAVLGEQRRQAPMTDAERDILFGKTQHASR